MHRFGGADGIAIIKNGDTVRIYDYATKNITRPMTVQETTAALQKARRAALPDTVSKAENENSEAAVEATPTRDAPIRDEQSTTESEAKENSHSGKTDTYLENFQKRIEAWDKKTEGFSFVMGESPVYLSELKVRGKKIGKKQVRIDATKIKKVMHDHPEMTIDVIKNLPHLLNDPILVLDSKTVEGRLVLLGEVYANGKPVMMALEINPTTRSGNSTYVDVIKVAGAYTRSNTQNMINTSNIRYVNENKSRVSDWLKVNRLQLPLPNAQSDSASTPIIPDSSEKSNTSEKDSSKKRSALPESERTDAVKHEKPKAISTDDIDAFAKENVKGYEDLLPAERREIRAMIRQGKALGVTDADIKTYARVAARSGIRVAFSKERTVYTKEDGTRGYADGFYDPVKNEIVVNPEGTRSPGKLLMHELSHALYSYKKYRSVLDKATRRMDEERGADISKRYREAGETTKVISEELAVHHAEDVLGSKANLERVVEEEPNIKSKILSFFRVAKTAYGDDSRLSLNAGRLYRHFEKAFNDFAARNKHNLAAETTPIAMRGGDGRMALPDIDTVDLSQYNEITLNGAEAASVQREAFVWHANKRNKPIKVRANGFVYLCVLDNDAEIHCYAKEKTKNIHESGGRYDNGNSGGSDRLSEKYRSKQERYANGGRLGRYRRNSLEIAADDGGSLQREREGDRGRGRQDAPDADRKQEEFRQRLLSQGYYEEGGYIYAHDGSKTTFFFPDKGRRRALPDTTEAVGKTKKRYEPSKKEAFFTAKDRAYIETVDELYGIEKYLHKIGGTAKAAVEADVQLARAARSQAQTMIGSVQYNVFSDKPERMGDGLLEIYKPTRLWSQEKYTAFDNYLLHQLNIDRMTLESRSKTWTAAERAQIAKVEGDIPLSEDDFANLADHIHNFDGVLSINDYNGKTEVHLYRKSEQGYYQIITVVSSERKSLQITKLIGVSSEKFEQKFAKKIERNTGSPRMHLASTPSTKARHTAGVLSTNSIPDSAKKINPSDEILFLV